MHQIKEVSRKDKNRVFLSYVEFEGREQKVHKAKCKRVGIKIRWREREGERLTGRICTKHKIPMDQNSTSS